MSDTPDSSDNSATTATITQSSAPPQRPPFLERLSDGLQNGIKVLIGSNRKPPRLFKTLLHGTFLGHPLHPAITDVPIGAWLLTAVLDVLWLASPGTFGWAPRAALVAVLVGLVGALGAFVTGAADWSDSYGAERRVGLYHGLLNTSAIVLFAISAYLRFQQATGDSLVAALLGFVGLGSVLFAAYFGGDMVFVKGTGVNHTAWEPASEDFEAVAAVAGVPENRLTRVMTGAGVPVVLLRMGGKVYAIAATCTHAGGPLDEGELQGDVVQCPWHGSRFRVRDGHVLTGPATVSLPRYEVRERDGQVEIKRVGGH
jgi:nitrite reductase/ring-hydroxylating ferredoxin subunit/uncharacterized membrane protein